MNLLFFILGLLFLPDPALRARGAGNITVTLDTLHADRGGDLIVALYVDKESWLDFGKAYRVSKQAVVPGLKSVAFDLLPAGKYAVQVLHDEDRDGKMGFAWFPPGPTEGSGISNNHVRMGKPLFEPALVTVNGSLNVIRIIMRY